MNTCKKKRRYPGPWMWPIDWHVFIPHLLSFLSFHKVKQFSAHPYLRFSQCNIIVNSRFTLSMTQLRDSEDVLISYTNSAKHTAVMIACSALLMNRIKLTFLTRMRSPLSELLFTLMMRSRQHAVWRCLFKAKSCKTFTSNSIQSD